MNFPLNKLAVLFACAAFGPNNVEALAPIGCVTNRYMSYKYAIFNVAAGSAECKAVAAGLDKAVGSSGAIGSVFTCYGDGSLFMEGIPCNCWPHCQCPKDGWQCPAAAEVLKRFKGMEKLECVRNIYTTCWQAKPTSSVIVSQAVLGFFSSDAM